MRERWAVVATLAFVALAVGFTVLPEVVQGSAASQAEDWTVPHTPVGRSRSPGHLDQREHGHAAAAPGPVR